MTEREMQRALLVIKIVGTVLHVLMLGVVGYAAATNGHWVLWCALVILATFGTSNLVDLWKADRP